MSSPLAARLALLSVQDDGGRTIPLGRTWVSRPAVLAFVRHFG